MAPDRFAELLDRHYLVYFPDTQQWVRQLAKATRAAWLKLFADIDERDFIGACSVLCRDPLPAYERERLGWRLRVESKRCEFRRLEYERTRKTVHAAREPRGGDGIAVVMKRAGVVDYYKLTLRLIEACPMSNCQQRAQFVKNVSEFVADQYKQGATVEQAERAWKEGGE